MSHAITAARILLGLLFAGFGLKGFQHLNHGASPSGPSGHVVSSDPTSRYSYLVFGVQLLAGALLLANFCVPFALILLAEEIVKLVNYYLTVEHKGLATAVGATVLWIIVAYPYRAALFALFSGGLQQPP